MITDSGIAITGATDDKGVIPFDLAGSGPDTTTAVDTGPDTITVAYTVSDTTAVADTGSDSTTVADTGTTNGNRTVSPISIKGCASVLHGHILLQYTCIIISLIIYILLDITFHCINYLTWTNLQH